MMLKALRLGGLPIAMAMIGLLSAHAQTEAEAEIELAGSRPNIIVILCDDLGWGDLQCYGHPEIKTPHLDQLAADGIRFTSFYSASPVCSPSRVGLLTGRTPNRAGVFDWIPETPDDPAKRRSRHQVQLRASETTLSQVLKDAGYATCVSGKWHCNSRFNSPEQSQPGDFGFDHWFATQNNASPSHENPDNFVRNGEPVGVIEGFSCQIVVDEAIQWLENRPDEEEVPFFLYVAFHEPHEPVASPPELVARHEISGASNHDEAQYFANVENLDAAVGRLLESLDDQKLSDDTLVIFTSDNGPETLNRYANATRSYGSPGPWRGMKLHTHEAGYRVAGIMRWPGKITAGQVSEQAVCSLDFLPTFATLAGAELPEELQLDGADFLPALTEEPITREHPLTWVFYNALNGAQVALLQDDWKILGRLGIDGKQLRPMPQVDESNIDRLRAATFFDFEVFNLRLDPGETEPREIDGQRLDRELLRAYGSILRDMHVWPAVDAEP